MNVIVESDLSVFPRDSCVGILFSDTAVWRVGGHFRGGAYSKVSMS